MLLNKPNPNAKHLSHKDPNGKKHIDILLIMGWYYPKNVFIFPFFLDWDIFLLVKYIKPSLQDSHCFYQYLLRKKAKQN